MSQARFLFLSTQVGSDQCVAWRLVAGNNHDLGRSPVPLADAAAARLAVDRLRDALPRATSGHAPDSRPGRWGWQLKHESEVLAVSSRWYERQRESRYSLQQFLAAVPVAAVTENVAVRPRSRELRRGDLRIPRAGDPAAPRPSGWIPSQGWQRDVVEGAQ